MATEHDKTQDVRIASLEEAVKAQTEVLTQIRNYHMPWFQSLWQRQLRMRVFLPLVKVCAAVSIVTGAVKFLGWYLGEQKLDRMAERYAEVANRLYFEENNADVSLEFVDKALAIRPNNAEYRFKRAFMAGASLIRAYCGLTRPFTKTELDQVHRIYAEALSLGQLEPKRYEPFLLQAYVLTALKEYDRAEASALKALEMAPQNTFVHLSYAELLFRSRRFEDFERELAAASALDPQSKHVLFWQGVCAQNVHRDMTRARTFYEAALAVDPKFDQAWHNIGWTWLADRTNGLAQARSAMQNALKINPYNKEACYAMAKLSEFEDKHRVAKSWLDKAVNLDPNYLEALKWRGIVSAQLGNLPAALSDFDAALLLDPLDGDLYIRRATVFGDTGDPAAALADLELALEIDPASDRALAGKAKALLKLGKYEEALAAVDAAMSAARFRPERHAPLKEEILSKLKK